MWSDEYTPYDFYEVELQRIHHENIYKLIDCNTNLLIYGKSGSGKNICVRNSIYKYLNIDHYNFQKITYILPNDHKTEISFLCNESNKHIEIILDKFGSVDKQFIQCFLKEKLNTMFLSSTINLTYKYIILYNIHNLSNDAQRLIKTISEKFGKSGRFILTSKSYIVNDSLKSAFMNYIVPNINTNDLLNFLKLICNDKNVLINEKGLIELIENNNNNIELCINKLQLLKVCNKSKSIIDEKIISLFNKIRKKVDIKSIRNDFYNLLIYNLSGTDIMCRLWKLFSESECCEKNKIIHIFAATDHALQLCEREIFHFEYMVFQLWTFI